MHKASAIRVHWQERTGKDMPHSCCASRGYKSYRYLTSTTWKLGGALSRKTLWRQLMISGVGGGAALGSWLSAGSSGSPTPAGDGADLSQTGAAARGSRAPRTPGVQRGP